ncbi:MAG: TadE/TadG family type IV pilus assembly protein [Acidimicrobiia bacterium]
MRLGDRGAAMLETALITPVFFALIFGIIEFGLVYRDTLTAADAAGSGARMGAILGPRPTPTNVSADFEIIRAVRQSLGAIPVEWVDRIVVFKAQGPGAGSPTSQITNECKNGVSVPGLCNVYDPGNAFLAIQSSDNNAAFFECPSGRACPWAPYTRKNGPTVFDIEYLGVWIRIQRPGLTGLFAKEFTIEQASVVRLEPSDLELGGLG